ncbi:putative DNA-binding domain-containing protein [Alloalcanivorax sp. C16-1]|uniref:HvfC/BufC family peptide modification chaperone n=1 Tax=Alloalcanivorax sp. C16-1 TaxID=3390051 RepID=UPI003970ED1F
MSDQTLAEFQTRVVARLSAPSVASEAPGWRVYRNTVLKGCVDALQAGYPAVTRLVGETWLRAAATVYAREHPPGDPRLFLYGADFPVFLTHFKPAEALPYLPAVARLDRLWQESHVAADAPVTAAQAIAGLAPEPLSRLVLAPHPAARWAWFEGVPAYTLWRANREHRTPPAALNWDGEGALLTRPEASVRWQPLSAAGVALLNACALGRPVMEAAAEALALHPGTDLSLLIAALLKAGAFTAVARQADALGRTNPQ